ncbi:MAG: serine protease [Elusimicrobiota bacterium]|jgi:hypothetical protein
MNRSLRLALLVSLSCAPAWAQLQKTKFYLPEYLPERPAEFERAYDATVRLVISESSGLKSSCSSAFISQDGYILTNLHCIEPCLEQEGWFQDGRASLEEGAVYKIVRIRKDSRAPQSLFCEDVSFSVGDNRLIGAHVVLLGAGRSDGLDRKIDEAPASALKGLRANIAEDFALLKFDLPQASACLPVSPAAPAAGQALWIIGYPQETYRNDGYDSDGIRKLITLGIVRKSIREDPYLQSRMLDKGSWLRLSRIYSNPHLLMSGLDAVSGNSGGPLVDASGRLAGIHWGTIAYSRDTQVESTALGVRIEHIVASVQAALGKDKAAGIFSCPAQKTEQPGALRTNFSIQVPSSPPIISADAGAAFFDGMSSR